MLERHSSRRTRGGARLVLADQVGLGKTVQLAMAALLMALDDPAGGPILVLAPKPLLQQWQDELMELLRLPSARWNGRRPACQGAAVFNRRLLIRGRSRPLHNIGG